MAKNRNEYDAGAYDVVVIGAGHAGCEAALASARMGRETLLLTMNLDAVALMACNPSIGGTAKGHLVREVDALGGEMGLAIDDTFLQSKMLNTGKGPAVHSLRAQADKKAYQSRMLSAIFNQPRLTVRQAEIASILCESGSKRNARAVISTTGARFAFKALIVATGVYLKSRVIMGDSILESGPQGLFPARALSDALVELGFELRRFKTGTPARIDGRSIDFEAMIPQYGDERIVPFSFMTDKKLENKALCYLTYTNELTHDIIRQNLDRAPMFSGKIKGTGARYCPSIEDKVTRFADKERHQVFLEPEGLTSPEWYVQGVSTSLPEDVQTALYRTIKGLERSVMVRPAYAIEYDCIDPCVLELSLGCRDIAGLYFAGQINGTSGYEEAAAQGLLAGINAALYAGGAKEVFQLSRSEAYMGVLVDDLVTKGTDEPYRMMTSRAEYRLILRQDNADLRLTERGYQIGLVSDERMRRMDKKREETEAALAALRTQIITPSPSLQRLLDDKGEPRIVGSITAYELLKRPSLHYSDLEEFTPKLHGDVEEQVDIAIHYEGYLKKQEVQVNHAKRLENRILPQDIDYMDINSLRIEARQKLNRHRPTSIGQASRLPGVSPGDIAVLIVYLEKEARKGGMPCQTI